MRTALAENTVINNRYVVKKSINSKVLNQMNYLCVDETGGQQVLVKEFFPVYAGRNEAGQLEYGRLPDDDMEKFTRANNQAKIYGKIPTLTQVKDVFSANNTVYAVCEYYRGKTVSELIAEGNSFSKTTVQNTMIMLLKTNMTLAKFGICNKNYHPDNILVTEDGYIKIKDFYPRKLETYESESTKSIAGLGFFMMTGEDTEFAVRARKNADSPREQELIDYTLSVIEDGANVTSKEFYNAALLRFDKKALNTGTGKNRSFSSVSFFSRFSRKQIIVFAAVFAFLFLSVGIFAGYRVMKDIKNAAEIGFTSVNYSFNRENDNDGVTIEKNEFEKTSKDLLGDEHYEKTIDGVKKTEDTMDFILSVEDGVNIEWLHNGETVKTKGDGKNATVKIDKEKDGKIEIVITKGTKPFVKKAVYTIKYTHKTFAKLSSVTIKYYTGETDEGKVLEEFKFKPDTMGWDVTLPASARFFTIEVKCDENGDVKNISQGADGALIPIGRDVVGVTVELEAKDKEKNENNTYHFYFSLNQITVPGVYGMTENDALNKLKSLGFSVNVARDNNNDVSAGKVYGQSIKAETLCFRGDAITIYVSTGAKTATTKTNAQTQGSVATTGGNKSENEDAPKKNDETTKTTSVNDNKDDPQTKEKLNAVNEAEREALDAQNKLEELEKTGSSEAVISLAKSKAEEKRAAADKLRQEYDNMKNQQQ